MRWIEHLRLGRLVIAQVVLAIRPELQCLLIVVTAGFGYNIDGRLGEDLLTRSLLSEEVLGRIDHFGLSL